MTVPAQTIDVVFQGRRLTVAPGTSFVVGRGQPTGVAGLNIDDPLVSSRHVVVWFTSGGWYARSEGRNGTFLNGQRVEQFPVTAQTTLRLAGPSGLEVTLIPGGTVAVNGPPAVSASSPERTSGSTVPPPGGDNSASAIHQIVQGTLTIGRAPDNSVVLDDLLVSRYHATLRFDGRVWLLSDLNSANGTYVDGRRIMTHEITPQSIIGIGHQTFRLRNGRLAQYQDTGEITFEARNLTFVADHRTILDNVSFVLQPNTMLVIVGPSGSGKSTLLKALNGTQPASQGQVGYGGRDLYSNYDEIRHRIGFVPQDDILHPQLRVRDALDYAAQLRFPQDVPAEQRRARVEEVIAELGLLAQADQRVSTLSGGQRKRTSTAMELLTRPSLLFLDEPTSGLDINRDREVMTILRKLADGGRTVIVVSHNVAYLNLADTILVMATGGQLAYYGPPAGALQYFGSRDYADMYAALEQPRGDWRQRFEASPLSTAEADRRRPPITGRSAAPEAVSRNAQQTPFAQFWTLCRRYLSVISADKQFVILMIAMPIILAAFAHAVPGGHGLSVSDLFQKAYNAGKITASNQNGYALSSSRAPAQLLLVLIISASLVGAAVAVREVVKERPIFQREKAIGLGWLPYLLSKFVVLTVITCIQAIVLTFIATLGDPGPVKGVLTSSGMFEIYLVMMGVTVASMCIGLILSTVVTNADRVMPLLVLVIIMQLLLCGGLFPIHGRPVLEQLSWITPSRWAFAAAASDVRLGPIGDTSRLDPLWKHTSGHFVLDLVMLGVLTVAYLTVTGALVRRIGRIRTAQ